MCLSLYSTVERWKKIEAEYIKKGKVDGPSLKRVQNSTPETRFLDYPDRPKRYRYWYLETKYTPPSKRKSAIDNRNI